MPTRLTLGALVFLGFALASPAQAAEMPRDRAAPSAALDADCNFCHTCPGDPEQYLSSPSGASTLGTWKDNGPSGCVDESWCIPWEECRPPMTEEAPAAEVALTAVIDGDLGVLDWIQEYGSGFRVELAGQTVAIARQCGRIVTWVSLAASEVELAASLLAEA